MLLFSCKELSLYTLKDTSKFYLKFYFRICYILLKKKDKKAEKAVEGGTSNGLDKDKTEQNGDPQNEITSL